MKALSIRQPWAWLIVHGWKNIENRCWPTQERGRFLIHASKSMSAEEYDACAAFVAKFPAVKLPPPSDLPRGGIVGEAVLLDCVDWHPSEWFEGPFGLVIDEAKPVSFRACAGRLKFFEVDHGI
jgi:hypothetical protein